MYVLGRGEWISQCDDNNNEREAQDADISRMGFIIIIVSFY